VNAKLTLLKNRTRKTSKTAKPEDYPYKPDGAGGDDRFLENLVGIQSIAASSAQNDAGLFELNFRDERFLPFEGAGVISTWRLELPTAYRHFDYDTISDVVMHISYTARDGGDAFKGVVTEHITGTINKWLDELAESETGLPRLFSLRHEFPSAFHRLLNPSPGSPHFAEFEVTPQHFPYFLSGKPLKLSGVTLYLKPKDTGQLDTSGLTMAVKVNGSEGTVGDTSKPWGEAYKNLKEGALSLSGKPIGKWTIEAEPQSLNKDLLKDHLEDIMLLLKYTVSKAT
jgi:hypothetical protein